MSVPNTPTGVLAVRLHHEPGADLDVHVRFQLAYAGGPPGTDDLAIAATAVRTAFSAHLASLLYSGDALYDTSCADLKDNATPAGVDTTTVVGTRTGTQVPNNCTVLLNKAVNRKYRGAKPKNFLPYGVQADLASTNSWSTTFATAVTNGWTAFITALDGVTAGAMTLGAEVAVSYDGPPTIPNTGPGKNKTMSTPRAVPLVQTVTANQASTIIGSQRRRLRAG